MGAAGTSGCGMHVERDAVLDALVLDHVVDATAPPPRDLEAQRDHLARLVHDLVDFASVSSNR